MRPSPRLPLTSRPLLFVACLLFLQLPPAARAQDREPPARVPAPSEVLFDATTGTLSVAVVDFGLAELLAEIDRQSGLEVRIVGHLVAHLSARFDGVPVARALRQLLRGRNYVLRYPSARSSSRSPATGSLWVYAAGSETSACGRAEPTGCQAARACGEPNAVPATVRTPRAGDIVAALDLPDPLRALDELSAAALGDGRPNVRLEAVHGLGELGEDAAVPTLEEALADPDARIRSEAVAALTDIGGEGAAWALLPALQATDARLREEAAYALGEIGGEAAVVLLRQALADSSGAVRETAVLMLDELDAEP